MARRPKPHRCGAVQHFPVPEDAVEQSITACFAGTVARHGDCVAIADGDSRLTYTALAQRATAVAQALTALEVGHEERVALLVDPGATAVASVLGVLEAGAAFAPLDVLDPPQRARDLVELAGARVLIASSARIAQATAIAVARDPVLAVVGADLLEPVDGDGSLGPATPGSAASVFFTSGSTGTPKAVLDTHRNVLHNALRYTNLLQISPADRLSLVQRLSFSGIASSLFTTITTGATLCTFPLTPERLPTLARWVEEESVTVFHAVPAIFRALLAGGRRFPDVRVLRLEGDRASWRDVELFRQSFPSTAVLANGLGTTETGLACQFRVGHDTPLGTGILPVGYPAPGMEILILDADGTPCADGEIGEIAVRSRFLARGYLGAPQQTAERFLSDASEDRRTYLTGDLGRFDERSRIECLGRLDGTHKVGGVRVEPAEIDAALLRLDSVREAATTIEAGRGEGGRIVARVVPARPGLSEVDVRRSLEAYLPAFMIPARIGVVAALAVDTNWKTTRTPVPGRAPRTDRERVLLSIWQEVLEVEIGVDDMFVDLGGDSLAAAEIVAAVEEELDLAVPMSLLARAPTVARMAAALRTGDPDRLARLVVLRDGGDGVPLVLIPDHEGNPLMYAAVARAVAAAHPVWAVQLSGGTDDDLSIPALAREVAATLRDAHPEGPYLVGGYCYGALVAFETARVLRETGAEVRPILLGLLPTDVPTLVSDDARARWRQEAGRRRLGLRRIRFHLGRVRHRAHGDAVVYLAGRLRTAVGLALRVALGRPYNDLQLAAVSYRPTPLPGAATLVLAAAVVATYTDNPAAAWGRLADRVDVRLLEGVAVDHELLGARGSGQLGSVLSALAESAGADRSAGSAQMEP